MQSRRLHKIELAQRRNNVGHKKPTILFCLTDFRRRFRHEPILHFENLLPYNTYYILFLLHDSKFQSESVLLNILGQFDSELIYSSHLLVSDVSRNFNIMRLSSLGISRR